MSDRPRSPFTWKQKILFLLLALVAPFWLRIAYYAMTQERLHPSQETTYLTEPLREDGTVDYAAALNELNKQGVTPENNAAVVLAEFYGPSVAGPEYCAEIGIDPLPVNGDYYESFDGYSGRDPEFRIHFPGMPVEEPGEDREIIAQFDLAKWLPWTVER